MAKELGKHCHASPRKCGLLALILAGVGLLPHTFAQTGMPLERAEKNVQVEPLCIVGPGMRVHRFEVEVADDDAKRQRGLMFRRQMAAEHGMLFVYPKRRSISMWMKNTYLPLDMLFIEEDGAVSRIEADTTPESERVIRSEKPAVAVLELNAGEAQRRVIRAGDQILHPRFGRECPSR
ncbi:MAG: uncharacterized membrane protein (UPF0127 family) [Gammaproteobacteria bacterium]|jgi:uncharacterized membrane protein (UPF0127 family)